jgi:hypothetical protein
VRGVFVEQQQQQYATVQRCEHYFKQENQIMMQSVELSKTAVSNATVS